MRSGCTGLLVALTVWVISAALISIGVILLVFGVFTLDPSLRPETVVTVIAAPIGAYLLIRIGRDILRDLREGLSGEDERKERE